MATRSSGLREKRQYEVRKKFGVLFQDGALFGSMSLYDNIAFPYVSTHTRAKRKFVNWSVATPNWSD
jgi:ABC-type transporter Mla maintaining outer membrane lipid asymmetry ATPase subunit MlaF